MKREPNQRHELAHSSASRARGRALRGAVLAVLSLCAPACAGEDAVPAGGDTNDASSALDLYAGIPQDGVVLGDPSAPVTLIEFTDLRCSHCRDYALEVLPAILDRHVRTGQVKLVFRNLAFLGPSSVRAARMAAAVGAQDRLWEFVDHYFRWQARERPAQVTDDDLARLAGELPGVDVEEAMAQRDGAEVDQQLAAAREEARRFQIRGVPAFFLSRTGEAPRALRLSSMSVEPFSRMIADLLREPAPRR
jgi:protein-disulfide isomerase